MSMSVLGKVKPNMIIQCRRLKCLLFLKGRLVFAVISQILVLQIILCHCTYSKNQVKEKRKLKTPGNIDICDISKNVYVSELNKNKER